MSRILVHDVTENNAFQTVHKYLRAPIDGTMCSSAGLRDSALSLLSHSEPEWLQAQSASYLMRRQTDELTAE